MQRGSGWYRAAKGYAQVSFANQPLFDGVYQKFFRRRGLCQQHKAAGAGVQPVAQARLMDGVPSLFLIQAAQYAVQQGVRFVAIHRDTRGLVGHDQIIVFINKFRRGACLQKLRPLLGGQSKLVVQQVNADHIAVLHTGGKGLLFAVQLNFVFPQRLIQPPQPQGRELLHQVFVQPYGQKAFYM